MLRAGAANNKMSIVAFGGMYSVPKRSESALQRAKQSVEKSINIKMDLFKLRGRLRNVRTVFDRSCWNDGIVFFTGDMLILFPR